MPDNLKRIAPEDPKKVNVNQPHEMRYWTKSLGVTEDKLRQAVKMVGPMVVDIKRHLGK